MLKCSCLKPSCRPTNKMACKVKKTAVLLCNMPLNLKEATTLQWVSVSCVEVPRNTSTIRSPCWRVLSWNFCTNQQLVKFRSTGLSEGKFCKRLSFWATDVSTYGLLNSWTTSSGWCLHQALNSFSHCNIRAANEIKVPKKHHNTAGHQVAVVCLCVWGRSNPATVYRLS